MNFTTIPQIKNLNFGTVFQVFLAYQPEALSYREIMRAQQRQMQPRFG